jgi:putative ABC transport system permease protein
VAQEVEGSRPSARPHLQYVKVVLSFSSRLREPSTRETSTRGQLVELQIVGVFNNVRRAASDQDYPEINISFLQNPWPQASIVVRSDGNPEGLINSIAAAVNSVDPEMPLAGVKTIDDIVNESLAIDRFSVVLFGCFGILGLLLSAVGIYGVMAFAVAQRTHEFGIRIALGAQQSQVLSMVLKEGTILALVGAAIGLGGAYLVGRAMQSTLHGVDAMDVQAFTAVSFLLLVAAWAACLVPALRASRVDPMVALRDMSKVLHT